MRKIRKGDQVIVLSGRDKGRRGAVLQVLADGRVLIESVNMVKKHTKPNPQSGKPRGSRGRLAANAGRSGRTRGKLTFAGGRPRCMLMFACWEETAK